MNNGPRWAEELLTQEESTWHSSFGKPLVSSPLLYKLEATEEIAQKVGLAHSPPTISQERVML